MNVQDNIAISVQDVSKTFVLPHQKANSVKSAFLTMLRSRRTYERQRVLNKVSLEVKKGEFFGIVGRNGGGKSTLLKLISGIYSPDSGGIAVNGKLIPFIELGVGFNPELTGRENIYLNGALLGFSTHEVDAMYEEIVEFAELGKFMDQKLNNYSSGMQVRLAFSIAVKADADILVLDEVLAVGDANFQQKCLRQFRKFKQEGKTIILVTHSMEYVEKFCDRALMLHSGEVRKIGTPTDIAFEYAKLNSDPSHAGLSSNEIGNKRVIFTETSINSPNTVLSPGEDLIITAQYQRKDPGIKTMYMALGLYHHDGVYVVGVDMQTDKLKPVLVRDKGEITLAIKDLPLLSGVYTINVAIYEEDREDPLHFLRGVGQFTIIDHDSNRGLVKTKHKWSTD